MHLKRGGGLRWNEKGMAMGSIDFRVEVSMDSEVFTDADDPQLNVERYYFECNLYY